MDRTPSPEHGSGSTKRPTIGLLMSVSSFMSLCAKHANRVSRKLKAKPTDNNNKSRSPKFPPRSPLRARPKELFTSISSKVTTLVSRKNIGEEKEESVSNDFGDGGVWQREILMGDKCKPLNFSGVFYYDSNGTQLNELPPRSPRASPLPGYLTRRNQ